MARPNRIVRRSSPPNRGWAGLEVNVQVVAGNTAVLLATIALSNAGIDETILRSLGSFVVSSDQVAAGETQLGAIGMIVVSDQAIGVGITAVPHPVTDIDDDGWLVHLPIAQKLHRGDGTGFVYAPTIDFDSKVKRVVHDGQSVALVIENSSGPGLEIAGILRVLSMVRGT